jgi:hypothetical protein
MTRAIVVVIMQYSLRLMEAMNSKEEKQERNDEELSVCSFTLVNSGGIDYRI